MRSVRFAEAESNLKAVLDTVTRGKSAAVIRRRDKEDAVVMSLASYESMADTLHLLSTKANRDYLARSIAQFRSGRCIAVNLPPTGADRLQVEIAPTLDCVPYKTTA